MQGIRNIGIVAHVDAGKTTLTEQILYLTGKVRVLGKVDQGSSNMDWWRIEQERGITVFSEQAEIYWKDYLINIIDTPGHADFAAELDRALTALDGAILVISAVEGVQSHTEVIWNQLRKRRIPTLIFLNKLDRVGANPQRVYQEIKERLSHKAVPIHSTFQCEKDFHVINDLLQEKRYVWNEDFSEYSLESFSHKDLRQDIIEQIAEFDEEIFDSYFEERAIMSNQLLNALARLTRENKVFPILLGSSLRGIGVTNLLDYIIDLLPSPEGNSNFPLSALIYKVRFDNTMGKLCYVRIFSGRIKVREELALLQGDQSSEEKVTQIRKYSGSKYTNVDSLEAGEIGVLCGLSNGVAGSYLGKIKSGWETSFRPVLTSKVIPQNEENLFELLKDMEKLNQEEPALDLEWDPEEKQIKIKIMGLIQMEVVENLVEQRFGRKIKLGNPQVNYLESITEVSRGFCHFEPKKHYAEVEVEIATGEKGQGIKFISEINTDILPLQYLHSIEKAVPEALLRGPLVGRSVTDITIKLIAAKYHLEHTHGGDFRIATIRAIQQALERNNMILLEPFYNFKITSSKEHVGRIMSDIISLNGSFLEPEIQDERVELKGEVPVANFIDYPTELNIITSGQGLITVHFSRYDQCINHKSVIESLKNTQIKSNKEEDILYNSVSLFREKRKMKKIYGKET